MLVCSIGMKKGLGGKLEMDWKEMDFLVVYKDDRELYILK